MSFLLYLVYCVLLIRNQQLYGRGDSGYIYPFVNIYIPSANPKYLVPL